MANHVIRPEAPNAPRAFSGPMDGAPGWLQTPVEDTVKAGIIEAEVWPQTTFDSVADVIMQGFGIPPQLFDLPFSQVEEPRKKSTHKAEVVPFVRKPHPNPESTLLEVVPVWGYECVIRRDDWPAETDKAVYIVVDSLVDVRRPEFSFLALDANTDGMARIKPRRFKGVMSQGLLVPAPANANIGDDLAEQLGVQRYEPPEPGESSKDKFIIGGEEEAGPDIDTGPSVYDVDSFERYHHLFQEGEPIALLEKADGSNCRFVYHDGRFWVKTRKRWVKRVPDYSHITLESLTAKGISEEKAKDIVERVTKREPKPNSFWEILEKTPALMEFLKANPGTTVYGEIYGNTNRLKYGLPEGNRFSAFDIYKDGRFLSVNEARTLGANLPWVPAFTPFQVHDDGRVETVGIPYSFQAVKELSVGKTAVFDAKPSVIREGVVIRPLNERSEYPIGRLILKCVNPEFSMR